MGWPHYLYGRPALLPRVPSRKSLPGPTPESQVPPRARVPSRNFLPGTGTESFAPSRSDSRSAGRFTRSNLLAAAAAAFPGLHRAAAVRGPCLEQPPGWLAVAVCLSCGRLSRCLSIGRRPRSVEQPPGWLSPSASVPVSFERPPSAVPLSSGRPFGGPTALNFLPSLKLLPGPTHHRPAGYEIRSAAFPGLPRTAAFRGPRLEQRPGGWLSRSVSRAAAFPGLSRAAAFRGPSLEQPPEWLAPSASVPVCLDRPPSAVPLSSGGPTALNVAAAGAGRRSETTERRRYSPRCNFAHFRVRPPLYK